jgi:hypothetical protein
MRADKEILTKKEAEFSVARSDKIIISAHAIFEGIGIAGLISAAFWYTTAPIAPDGFNGPIATFTIAVSTIVSLFLAIPISLYGFRKLIADIASLHDDLTASVREFINSSDDLIYELLQLRSLFFSDADFKNYLSPATKNHHFLITDSLISSVCKKFNQFKSFHFKLLWQQPVRLFLSSNNNLDQINSVSFLNLLKNRDLSANKSIRKSLIYYIKNNFLGNEVTFENVVQEANQNLSQTGHIRNAIYGIASGVACSEVLLSIGWTVISILIGVKVILPISNLSWAIFALSAVFAGILFGFGMGLSRHKQKNNQLLNLKLKNRNMILIKTREYLSNSFTEQVYGQKQSGVTTD